MKRILLLDEKYIFENKGDLHKAGGVRFCTNSNKVGLYLKLKEMKEVYPYMGSTMTNGIYYIAYESDTKKCIFQNGVVNKQREGVYCIYENKERKLIQYDVYFPIANAVDEFCVDILNDSEILTLPKSNKRIVSLGGKMTYGCGCIAANNMYSNILARELAMEAINFGRCSDCFIDIDAAKHICEFRPCFIITECSCKNMPIEYLKEKLEVYLELLLERNASAKLIVLLEDGFYKSNEKIERIRFTKNVVDILKKKYVNRIFLIDLSKVLKNQEIEKYLFYDGLYNDWANWEIALSMIPIIEASL